MHALLIEGRLDVAAFIADELRRLGWSSYDVVDRERDAVRTAACRPPDLIIADEQILDGSGTAAVATICSKQKVAIVLITVGSIVLPAKLVQAVVLPKPFSMNVLEDGIREALLRVGKRAPEVRDTPTNYLQICPI